MLKQSLALAASLALLALSGCSLVQQGHGFEEQQQPEEVPPADAQTPPGAAPEEAPPALPAAPSVQEQHTPTRQYHLSSASSALVAQSRTQASGGNYVAANATLERAQRIEPNNPLVWIEIGQVQLQGGNSVQAANTGKKALQLASGDPATQAQAWRLIADSLKAQGKDADAADAERHAAGLAAR